MHLKKIVIVFILAFLALTACVVYLVNKASENPPSNVAQAPIYTPNEIKDILERYSVDKDDSLKTFEAFQANSKIPISEVEGLNDCEIVKLLMIRYLEHFRNLPPEHSLYIKGYTIDMVIRDDLLGFLPMIFSAIFPETVKNNEDMYISYFNIVGAIPRTAKDKDIFSVRYTIIPYKKFNTVISGYKSLSYQVPVTDSEFNTEWTTSSVRVSKEGTGLTRFEYITLSKDNNFYKITSFGSGL